MFRSTGWSTDHTPRGIHAVTRPAVVMWLQGLPRGSMKSEVFNSTHQRRMSESRYRLDEPLGEGGMASVWRAFDSASGTFLALKRLRVHEKSGRSVLFEREYHTLAGLRHPHIVEVFEYGADADGPYYTMELLEGADLRSVAPMPWPEVCRCLREVASALGVLHARRLLHRDVSPRNVWRTEDGRYKLIDFGALTAFGTPTDLVGTPPCIAPEAVYGQPLDQRADLYALGALGYLALTGVHAYPARSVAALASLWQQAPPAPSDWVARAPRDDLPPIPRELDQLLGALLSHDPMARPVSAAEVMDRLDALTGRERENHAGVVEGCLGSQAFVGRQVETQRLIGSMERAAVGRGGVALIEGAAGVGRSRFLQELAVEGRLLGATVLHIEATSHQGEHGVALGLALKLLETLPDAALEAAQPYKGILGHLSPQLRQRLRADTLERVPPAAGEVRMRIQAALRDWFVQVAEGHLLALLVDDVHALDEASAAWIATLGHASKQCSLWIAATLRVEHPDHTDLAPALFPALKALRQLAEGVPIEALTREEMFEVLQSVFGDAPHLGRLSERLHRVTQGNAAHCMALATHLVRRDIIGYVDGTWVLPPDISDVELPSSRSAAFAARIDALPKHAQVLGQLLSLCNNLIPLELCVALADGESIDVFSALDVLVGDGVLVGSPGGYRFAADPLRSHLLNGLQDERKRSAHLRMGRHMLQSTDQGAADQIEAALHLIQGGDTERGGELLTKASVYLAVMEPASAGPAIAPLEQALALYREAGHSAYEQIAVLAPLATSAYYVDRRLLRYTEELLEQLQDVLGLRHARTLTRYLGARLGLYVALAGAALRFRRLRKNPRVPTFREALSLIFNVVATGTGVCAICIDPERALRYTRTLEPLRALGKNHVASLIYEFSLCLTSTVQDALEDARQRWHRMLARLEGAEPIQDMTEHVRLLYLAGALYACGVLESWRDSPEALRFADRLRALGMKLYEMSADQILMLYFAHQGDVPRFEMYRDRVEMHAIQRGTAWQVETWAFSAAIALYLRTYDGMGLKRCVEQLQRLVKDVPSMERYTRRARGSYLLVRERYAEALTELEDYQDETPRAVIGWTRGQAMLVRVYNALGDHPRAHALCKDALQRVTPEDLSFTAMNLALPIEAALTEAYLGQCGKAAAQLDALIELHAANQGPLTMGALHDARARVALLAVDEAAFAFHRAETERWHAPLAIPSLTSRCAQLTHEGQRKFHAVAAGEGMDGGWIDTVAAVRLALSDCHEDVAALAQRALTLIVEESVASHAYLLLQEVDSLQLAAQVGGQPLSPELYAWATTHLASSSDMDDTTTADDDGSSPLVDARTTPNRIAMLRTCGPQGQVIVGLALLLGSEGVVPRADRLRAIADCLLDARAAERATATEVVRRGPGTAST